MQYHRELYRALCVLIVSLMLAPSAFAVDDMAAIRAELEALKAQYEIRINELEQRLEMAEQTLSTRRPQTQLETVATQPQPSVAAVPRGSASSDNRYNPAIGVIINGTYRAYDNNPDNAIIPGAPAGGESGLADEGFSVGESELIFSSNVDGWFYAQITAALEQEEGEFEIGLEEAYVDTLSMPANTTLRFGRFYSGVGYLNEKHLHSWDFADQALPYSVFMGGQYGDDGVQLRWLAPTDFYLEFGGELFRGSSFPAVGDAHDGVGTRSLFAHVGGDLNVSNSWSAGFSWLGARAEERGSGDEESPLLFTGNSDIYVANFVWKWAPNGNMRDRNFVFQSEYLWRREDGSYSLPTVADPQAINSDAAGWYAQMIYQWRPRWRTGLRIDGLDIDDPGAPFADTPLEVLGDDPLRYALMLDYSNSEFSRIRLQLNRDESALDTDTQLTLQYIMSIGAHGAHEF